MSRPRPQQPGQPMGAVLLGGGSRRMGTDKAALCVDGATLATRAATAVRRALTEVPDAEPTVPPILLVGRAHPPTPAPAGTWTLPDLRPDAGPLAGLETALHAARDGDVATVLLAPVDHPWLEPAVLRSLLGRLLAAPAARDAVVLGTGRGAQPLIGAYRTRALAAVTGLLDAGERRLRQVVDHLDVEVVAPRSWRPLDPSGASAVDTDTPVELDGAHRWHRRVVATASVSPVGGRDTPQVEVIQIRDGRRRAVRDELIAEEPLQILAAGPGQEPVPLITTVRTPGHEHELAVGWLLAEGLASPDDIVGVRFGDAVALARPDDTVIVSLRVPVDPGTVEHRHAVATASCGVCGRASIAALTDRLPRLPVAAPTSRGGGPATAGALPLAWDVLGRLPAELRFAQPRFAATGGVHAAGLFDHDGRVITVREDVGRHNALDAVIGAQALGEVWPADGLHDLVGVLSGRIGFELVAKAAAARLPILVAVGAASDLAVRTADALGVTLVGFLRDGDSTVYTHPERLALPGS